MTDEGNLGNTNGPLTIVGKNLSRSKTLWRDWNVFKWFVILHTSVGLFGYVWFFLFKSFYSLSDLIIDLVMTVFVSIKQEVPFSIIDICVVSIFSITDRINNNVFKWHTFGLDFRWHSFWYLFDGSCHILINDVAFLVSVVDSSIWYGLLN